MRTLSEKTADYTRSIPSADAVREFHEDLPLDGDPCNALLSLPDDLLEYVIALMKNAPRHPPVMSLTEWSALPDLLRPHWIIPLLAWNLRSWPEEFRPPREIVSDFEQGFLQGAAENLLTGRQIRSVLTALQEAGIPALLIKGHALARTVYPDPALRQSSDIDILVHPEDIPAGAAILEKLGYSCPVQSFDLHREGYHSQNFYPPGPGSAVDLQWSLSMQFGRFLEEDLDAAFKRKISITSGDLTFDTLSPRDHLLYQVFHTVFQHHSLRLSWIADVALLSREIGDTKDWESLINESVTQNARIPLERALRAAMLWTSLEIPKEFRDFSAWPVPSDREKELWKYASTKNISLQSAVFHRIVKIPGFRGKMGYVYYLVFPPLPNMVEYRRSGSAADIPCAHVRRWIAIVRRFWQ